MTDDESTQPEPTQPPTAPQTPVPPPYNPDSTSQDWAMPSSPPTQSIPTASAQDAGASPSAPPSAPPPGAPTPADKKSLKPWALVLAILLLVVGAVVGFLLVAGVLGSSAEGEVSACVIDADGSINAAGWVSGAEDSTLVVRFEDADTGVEVDRAEVSPLRSNQDRAPWTAEGQAGPEVDRVKCVLAN